MYLLRSHMQSYKSSNFLSLFGGKLVLALGRFGQKVGVVLGDNMVDFGCGSVLEKCQDGFGSRL